MAELGLSLMIGAEKERKKTKVVKFKANIVKWNGVIHKNRKKKQSVQLYRAAWEKADVCIKTL